MKLLENCTKERSILPAIQKNLRDMKIHEIQVLPAVFFDNL